jgi:hypothetical protein
MEGKPPRLFPLLVMLVLVVGIIVYLKYKG